MRRAAVLLVLLAVAAGCGGDDPPSEAAGTDAAGTTAAGTTAVEFERGTVRIESGRDAVTVPVEIAETQAQQSLGLMNRESLPEDEGMVFVFPSDIQSGFWMKDTLIPLSIAFYDGKGKILEIMDMEPCREDPCPVYNPGVPFRGALEANEGAFDEWGVEVGDTVTLER